MTPEEYEKLAESGRRAIEYAGKTKWWKRDAGLYPFFWRWPEAFQKEVRDGPSEEAFLWVSTAPLLLFKDSVLSSTESDNLITNPTII
jgi:hypothetical protein